MNPNPSILTFAEPSQLCLEIPIEKREVASRQSQNFSTPNACWNAYLNSLCASAVLPWLQEEFAPQAKVWRGLTAYTHFWEFVNGIAVTLDSVRFLLIPSESIDIDEMRVPQEWIDIPSWSADYYLAVQVEPDEGWVRVWGYATHQQLKTRGTYDASDRTYCLDAEDAIADISVLWVARQLGIEEATKAAMSPLPALSLAQADSLLARLGERAVIVPRLAVPFTLWGALLEHGGWRKQLYQKRLGRQEQWSAIEWLQRGVSQFAEQLGWERVNLQTAWQGARGEETTAPSSVLSRQLSIEGRAYELRAIPIGNLEERIWRFELRNTAVGGMIPNGFKLRLLTEDLQFFDNNEDVATGLVERLYVEVAIAPGEGLVWEVEPTPEDSDLEILRF
ncbi:MAG: DUF1822 family protein [Hydrococcus sp. Prado102]|jgi:hypothetical protein|nr:DUF1822 family protein [Hydrococcus sp. Prado102]